MLRGAAPAANGGPGAGVIRAAGYGRVSSPAQKRKGFSLPEQKEKIEARNAQEGFSLVAYEEDDFTGRRADRKGLERLQALAEARAFSVLWLVRVDRLARRAHLGGALEEFFEARGVTVLYVDQAFERNAAGRFQKTVMRGVAELEGDLITERTQAGRHRKALQRGLMPSYARPYGLRQITVAEATVLPECAGRSGELIPVSGEAEWIPPIFERIAGGDTIRTVLRWLDRSGAPTVKGGRWSVRTLHRVLHNPAYFGRAEYKGVPVRSAPLITEELFEAVRARLTENAEIRRGRPSCYSWPLAGCVFCGVCGRHARTSARRHRHSISMRYRCRRAEQALGDIPWCGTTADAADLYRQAEAWLRKALQPGRLASLVRKSLEAERKKAGDVEGQATEARATVRRCNEEERALLKKALLGFDEGLVRKELAALHAQKAAAEQVIRRAESVQRGDVEGTVAEVEERAAAVLEALEREGLEACAPYLRGFLRVTLWPGERPVFSVAVPGA